MKRMISQWSLGNVLAKAKQGSSGLMGVDVFVSPGGADGEEFSTIITTPTVVDGDGFFG